MGRIGENMPLALQDILGPEDQPPVRPQQQPPRLGLADIVGPQDTAAQSPKPLGLADILGPADLAQQPAPTNALAKARLAHQQPPDKDDDLSALLASLHPPHHDKLMPLSGVPNNPVASGGPTTEQAQTAANSYGTTSNFIRGIAGGVLNPVDRLITRAAGAIPSRQGLVGDEGDRGAISRDELATQGPAINYDPSRPSGAFGGGIGQFAQMALAPELAPWTMGAEGAESAQTEVEAERAAGHDVSGWQQAADIAGHGGLNAGMALLAPGGAASKELIGLTPTLENAGLNALKNVGIASAVGYPEGAAQQIAGNALTKYTGVNPDQALIEGANQAGLVNTLGAGVGQGLHESMNALSKSRQNQQAAPTPVAPAPAETPAVAPGETAPIVTPPTPAAERVSPVEAAIPAVGEKPVEPTLQKPIEAAPTITEHPVEAGQAGSNVLARIREGVAGPGSIYHEEVKPIVEKGADTLGAVTHAIGDLFPTEAADIKASLKGESKPESEAAQLEFRKGLNRGTNEHQAAMTSLEHGEKLFDQMPAEEQRAFQAAMYDRTEQSTPGLQGLADKMYAITNERRQQMADLGVDTAKDWAEQHWNMQWKQDPAEASRLMERINRPGKLGGAAGFLKSRTPGDFESKLAAGLVPVEDNPLRMFAGMDASQRQFIGAGRAVKGLAESGEITRLASDAKVPDGMVDITAVLPKSFRDLVKGEVEEKGGKIVTSDANARIIRNVVTPSWFQGGPVRQKIGDTLRTANNTLSQLWLGLSAAHLRKQFLEQLPLTIGAMAENVSRGDPGASRFDAAGRLNPFQTIKRGKSVQDMMLGLKSMTPEESRIVETLKNHMTAKPDSTYQNQISDHMMQAFKDGGVQGIARGLARSPFALNEKWMQDVVFKTVQHAKLSYAYKAVDDFLRQNPTASVEQLESAAKRISDHTDNILGLMNRDNRFWNRTARDLGQLAFLSVGWNYGTLRSFAGAVGEAGNALRAGIGKIAGHEVEAPQRRQLAYWLGAALTTGVYGSMYASMTGKKPQGLVDYIFPKNGQVDEHGRDQRENLGLYTGDMYEFLNHPLDTVSNKAGPLLKLSTDLVRNKDGQGNQIVNPNDSPTEQAEQLGRYVGGKLEPASIQSLTRIMASPAYQNGSALDKIAGVGMALTGFRNAPVKYSESDAEQRAYELADQERPQETPEQASHSGLLRSLATRLHNGDQTAWNDFDDAVQRGELSDSDRAVLRTKMKTAAGLGSMMKTMSADDALDVYSKMDASEKQQYQSEVRQKLARLTGLRRIRLFKAFEDAK
jgi:hypothetical protein